MTYRRLTVLIAALLISGCDVGARPGVSQSPPPPVPGPPPPGYTVPPAGLPAVRPPPLFGIGGGESDQHTHISFNSPRNLAFASVRIVVDRAAPVGLNFFALQVDFNNGTWAHGGVQDVDGPNGSRTRQVNWGGLVDRGGGNGDYDNQNDAADIEKIQNPPAGQHVGPYPWRNGVEYEYVIERGAYVTIPPGDYRMIPDRAPVRVNHPRGMWEWRFTVRPISAAGAPYVAVLYDSADSFNSFYVWNESGYGSTNDTQHTSWWTPVYASLGARVSQAPSSWARF